MRIIDCDYLVIGSGLAGLTTAWHLRERGRVVLAAKDAFSESNSDQAQAGIACAVDDADSVDEHFRDTLRTGRGLCRPDVVRMILSNGPRAIRFLESLGIVFSRQPGNGDYDLGQEGGHSHRRVLRAGDMTGHEVVKILLDQVTADGRVAMYPHLMAIDLVTTGWLGKPDPNRCIGAYFLDRKNGEILAIRASCTVLATGGAGKVYLYTSNPDIATGDGHAMAWRAGLPMVNMEFVQFHPTCLYHPKAKSFLVSEAVRGEGARLLNTGGERFMTRFDPRAELAPRDVVARAIDHEIKTRGDTCVYLDSTHRSRDFLRNRFPNIYERCLAFGFDMATDPVPVVPAAHYFCGGVQAAVDGATAMPGLFVVGETACTGLHGANRLASNSLLEAVVCAMHAAERTARDAPQSGALPAVPNWQAGAAVPSDEAVVVEHNWNEVRLCMWDYVGIVRTNKRLERAERRISLLRREIRQYYLDYLVTPDILELRNIAAVGELIIRSAKLRKESRGLHYSLDYPETGAADAADTVIRDEPGGSYEKE